MQRLHVVRHGQTPSNAARLIQGQRDVPLSETGRRQAEAVALALSAQAVDRIVSSPLARARETAEAVARRHALPVHTHEALRERAFGSFEGGPVQAYQDALAASGLARWDFRPPGGETIPDVWARCAGFLQALRQQPGEQVVVVAHEGVNRCLVLMLLGRPMSEWTSFRQDNCCINEFVFAADGTLAHFALNNTEHLAALA